MYKRRSFQCSAYNGVAKFIGVYLKCDHRSLSTIRARDWLKSITWFCISGWHLHNHEFISVESILGVMWIENLPVFNNCFINYKLLNQSVNIIFFYEFFLHRKLSFISVYTQLIWRSSHGFTLKLSPFQTSLKFGFLVYSTFYTICLIYWMQHLQLRRSLKLRNSEISAGSMGHLAAW